MKWHKDGPGRYRSHCKRWVVKGKGTHWTLWDVSRPKGDRKVGDKFKSKRIAQGEARAIAETCEQAVELAEEHRAKREPRAHNNPKPDLVAELRALRLSLDNQAHAAVQLADSIRRLAEAKGGAR